ncbi:metal/formaldehyde-sensitive transcriptional repressor [Labrys monachus]|uniref:DNA-binding FrmR family transcriptional regulator n=1 Tax=Labrys monachus TaxID=217067 RepID=A0ABU0FE07_9HYPH|nr:metal/formaldehyde-sensitive transcriptional repressor [Labrys monachus]MDQ0392848.1 DNA-binding FrmR family transcriptional regulator [Labrys monachus]
MTHTIHEKQKLLARIRRIRGQVDAIERALENEIGCDPVMHLLAGVRGSVAGMMAEVIEDHVRDHIMNPDQAGAASREAAEHLIDVIRSYLK